MLLIAAVSLLPVVLAGCDAGAGASAALAKDQTFVWPYVDGISGHPNLMYDEVLDPAAITTEVDAQTTALIYTNLVTFDSSLHVVPDAATHWDVDSTGTIYTFHLRPNLKFSDGTPLTAADFAYGIDRALDPNLCSVDDQKSYYTSPGGPTGQGPCGSVASTYLGLILGAQDRLAGNISTVVGTGNDPNKGVDVVDPQTLMIRLGSDSTDPGQKAEARPYFLQSLAYPTSAPIEKALDKKYPGGLWVQHLNEGGCSGPFMVESYANGQELTLVPNPYWAQAFGTHLTLTSVKRPVVTSIEQEYQNYRSGVGGYDYTDVPANLYTQAYGQPDFHEVPALATDYFGINTGVAPFDSLPLRQAFDLALNRQLLVDRIENGGALPTNHIVPLGMPGYDSGLLNPAPDRTQSITGNQSAAQSLMAQAQKSCPQQSASTQPSWYQTPVTEPDYCAYITGSSPKEIDLNVANSSATRLQLAQGAASQWNSVLGVNVHVIPTDRTVLYPQFQWGNKLQMWEVGWIADYPDPQDWLSNQFLTGTYYNASNLSDSKLDALLHKADTDPDPTRRLAEYNQAEQMVSDDVAWIAYQQDKTIWRMNSHVANFSFNGLGIMEDIAWPAVRITAD